MLIEILRAFALVFVAEMGDKTQILAMAFATKYDVKKVLFGIFIGAFLNHGIAVLLGSVFSNIISESTIQVAAGIAFIIFALWSLKMSEEDDNIPKKVKYGPTITVAIAFFIGELGDKTQLTAITLAADSPYPALILAGTVLGMVVTGALGIFVGIKLGNKIPEFFIKIGAAAIFFVVGFIKLLNSFPNQFIQIQYIILFVIIIGGIGYHILKPALLLRKDGRISYLQKVSAELSSYYMKMTTNIESICLGENICGTCSGKNCLVGYIKSTLLQTDQMEAFDLSYIENPDNQKNFDKNKVIESLRLTINQLKDDPKNIKFKITHLVRKNLEVILFGKYISKFTDFEQYKKELKTLDKSIYKKLNL